MKTKILSLLLCAALLLSFTGCKFSRPGTVVTVDGEAIPAGLYLLYQLQAYTDAQGRQKDTSVDVLADTIDGVSGTDYIHTATLDQCKQYVWINRAFDAAGMAFTADELSAIDSYVSTTYSGNSAWLQSNGVGQESYKLYYTASQKYQKLLAEYQNTDEAAVTDEEAMAYMDSTYAHIDVLSLPLTDASYAAVDDAAKAAVQATADTMAKALENGDDFDELAAETLENAFGIVGREYTEESLASYKYDTFVNKDTNSYDDEDFAANLLAGKEGMAGVTSTATSVVVYQKIAGTTDEEDFNTNYRSSIITEMQTAAYVAKITADTEGYTVEENASAVNTYSPKKIKLS